MAILCLTSGIACWILREEMRRLGQGGRVMQRRFPTLAGVEEK